MSNQAVAGTFNAQLTDTSQSLTSGQFVPRDDTPGNVGVCLSGGGSRALCAGMGQLRALSWLQRNGRSLLSLTRTLSTVSGGSWLGVTFEFLPAGTTDAQYLNQYVADQGALVPTTTAGHAPSETLDVLPAGNIGNPISSDLFSVPALGIAAFLLFKFHHTPPNFLWQVLIGTHILQPYGLYQPGDDSLPTALFSWDAATLAAQVTGPNPPLAAETAHLVASGAGHDRRPYLLCNTSMFLNTPATTYQLLAPVQATPFLTGIVGAPQGTDANGLAVGGGGVTSFAFSSNPTSVAGSAVSVAQQRQLSLAEIVGASSAAYAEVLENLFTTWHQEPAQMFGAMRQFGDRVADLLGDRFPQFDRVAAKALMDIESLVGNLAMLVEAKSDLQALKDLIPQFLYWPVRGAAAAPATRPTRFADGGNLENLGLAATLAYGDIQRLISFVNTDAAIAAGNRGVIGAQGNEVAGTRVVVTQDLPPLFGYQPYQSGVGYIPYAGDDTPVFAEGSHSQVFPAEQFAALLQGLWAATGSGANSGPAVFKQILSVQDNAWFGVRGGGRDVTVLWVYNSRVGAWYDLLAPAVQTILGDFADPTSYKSFPHYPTFDTSLSPTEINLLANLSAWVVAGDGDSQPFLDMYQ